MEFEPKLCYRYKAHLMRARVRMDSVTSLDEKVMEKLNSVKKLLASDQSDPFLLELITAIVSNIASAINEGRLVLKVSLTRFLIVGVFHEAEFAHSSPRAPRPRLRR